MTKKEEVEEDTKVEENNTKEINLKENFLPMLSLDEKSIGMSTAVDKKIADHKSAYAKMCEDKR